MKKTILLLILMTAAAQAQTIPTYTKPKEINPKSSEPKPKPKPAKTKIVYVDRPVTTTESRAKTAIKFVCDDNAILFIDGEKKGILKSDTPFRINLSQGEYIVKVVNPKDENDFLKWNYIVSEMGIEKLEEIKFKKIPGENQPTSKKYLNKTIPTKTDLQEAHLVGKVKSTVTNTYLVDIKKTGTKKGKLLTTVSQFYDEKGNRTEYSYAKQKITFNHDDQGKLITSMNYESSGAFGKTIATGLAFGLVGLAVKSIANSGKEKSLGNLTSKTSYDYDDRSKLIGSSTYSEKGKLISRSEMKRDGNGRLFETKSFDANNNLVSTIIYDENEHQKEMINFNDKGAQIAKFIYSWEGNNNTSIEYFQEGNLFMKTTSIFDDRNHVVEMATLLPSISTTATIVKFINDYDSKGNLIKTTGSTIVEVAIEYY